MIKRAYASWIAASPEFRSRLLLTYALLFTLNAVAWVGVIVASARYSLLLGLAPVAYGFGLRHAVDPDHIAAIDNTTRKLIQDGQRPVAVGLFFSLGHSTIVFALSVLIAASAAFVKSNLPHMQQIGAAVGTGISGVFLFLIAIVNVIILADIVRTWRAVRRGELYDDAAWREMLQNRGLIARMLRPLLQMVTRSWQMYLIGLLFGLGFDTASEVGILGMSATAGAGGMPVWLILLLPLLFVAGMSLVDTTDGIAMLGAYGWAYVRPVRKLYYNMNITLLSIIIALFIGGVEVLQVLAMETGASGGLFAWANNLNLANMGFYIIGIFLGGWLLSAAAFRLRHLDRLDQPKHQPVTMHDWSE